MKQFLNKPARLSDYKVFLDFDNTFCRTDILDAVIERYSINQEWLKWEAMWQKGEIGSKECLRNQMANVRVSEQELIRFLKKQELDPYALELIDFLRTNQIEHILVSDSFLFIIQKILGFHGLEGIKAYANNLQFDHQKLIVSFPNTNGCEKCAHCKKQYLIQTISKQTIYVGDGLSDICPSKAANIVFAKDRLRDYLMMKKSEFISYKNLKDVQIGIERIFHENKTS